MNRINSFTGPRVQQPPTPAASNTGRVGGFGSLLQGGTQSAAYRPGDQMMSGGQVVASALSAVSAQPHSGILNSYLSAIGSAPINADGTRGAAPGGPGQSAEQQMIYDLATLSSATLSNSILHMGNQMKVDLERE